MNVSVCVCVCAFCVFFLTRTGLCVMGLILSVFFGLFVTVSSVRKDSSPKCIECDIKLCSVTRVLFVQI